MKFSTNLTANLYLTSVKLLPFVDYPKKMYLQVLSLNSERTEKVAVIKVALSATDDNLAQFILNS